MEVNNFDCLSQDVDIQVSGAADIEVHAENSLELTISGSATVKYKGNPQISQQVSGELDLVDSN